MKRLSELQLTAHDKEWMKIHARKYKWTIERIRQGLTRKFGEDIDPQSIRAFVNEKERLPVSSKVPSKRSTIDRQTRAQRSVSKRLEIDSSKAEAAGDFDPKSTGEGKRTVLRAINLRRGQGKFRKELLRAYGGRCAITGCNCEDALEAAHILAYNGQDTNHVQNGLLLRSDIHTLFDLGRIGVDPITKKVLVAKSLKNTVYASLKLMKLALPINEGHHPNHEVLRKHAEEWGLIA